MIVLYVNSFFEQSLVIITKDIYIQHCISRE